jgi:hypothetical protein
MFSSDFEARDSCSAKDTETTNLSLIVYFEATNSSSAVDFRATN